MVLSWIQYSQPSPRSLELQTFHFLLITVRFFNFVSLALSLAAVVSAAPASGIEIREAFTLTAGNEASLPACDVDTRTVLEARKYKASKIDLSFPKKLKQGSIKQKELKTTVDLGKRAMYQALVLAGTILYGWHDENTDEPVEHFTIEPSKGDGASKGKIHVHRDGSRTQGPGGKATKGNGIVD